jgi:hypothetical protein
MVGLNKKEIDEVIINIANRKEQPSFSIGNPCYGGMLYGNVSFKDF